MGNEPFCLFIHAIAQVIYDYAFIQKLSKGIVLLKSKTMIGFGTVLSKY